jgi:hypothetical protein
MTATPESLAPQLRDDPTVEPPYSSSQISETAIHREILRIYQMARRETRPVYDLGRDTAGIEEENWVIRWMLWHVFRYRDNRNKNRRTQSPGDEPDSGGGGISPNGSVESAAGQSEYHAARTAQRSRLTGLYRHDTHHWYTNEDRILGSCPRRLKQQIATNYSTCQQKCQKTSKLRAIETKFWP